MSKMITIPYENYEVRLAYGIYDSYGELLEVCLTREKAKLLSFKDDIIKEILVVLNNS